MSSFTWCPQHKNNFPPKIGHLHGSLSLCSKQLSEALEVVHEFKDVARPQGHALWVLINELVKQGHPQEELTTALDTLRNVPHVTRQNVDDLELEVYVRNGKMDAAKDVIQVCGCGLLETIRKRCLKSI